ncbi:MAG: hypothetical protein E7058_05570 [Lentisphaerae bacterium]|nr:hypothetical protein [Lentisphaerota bacterium]
MKKANDLYCNPVPLPDLPPAMVCQFPGSPPEEQYIGERVSFREVADPEVLYFEGKWYMYPSCAQVYVSEDLIHWEYHRIDIDNPLGYAPCVTVCKGRVLVTSSCRFEDSHARIYAAPHPLGPFKACGPVKALDGSLIQWGDPALFTDDDGRLYLYGGCAPAGGGIYGVELDPDDPSQAVSEAVTLFTFDPANDFEHYGEHGEVLNYGWDEGCNMYKYNGVYYLQYAACATQFRSYCIGVYMGKNPLGPFEKPAKKMVLRRDGIVSGTGHGGMFTGPEGRPFQAYTVLVRRVHGYERRVGIDPVKFDENGVPAVQVSDTPQSVKYGDAGLVNAAANKRTEFSSSMPFLGGAYAVDECPHTCWVPSPEDRRPELTVNLGRMMEVSSLRLIWAEMNLDYSNGVLPEPAKFTIEFLDSEKNPVGKKLDFSANTVDKVVDFITFEAVKAHFVRLTILRDDSPMHRGVSDLAVFTEPFYWER